MINSIQFHVLGEISVHIAVRVSRILWHRYPCHKCRRGWRYNDL